jgi:Glycosyltransferase family 87
VRIDVARGGRLARPLRWALVVAAAGLMIWTISGLLPYGAAWDAPTYLAAGERLNAGHELYALSPGDRPVAEADKFGSPLLSPPLVAVVWRPLALLGDVSMVYWWLACVAAIAVVMSVVIGRGTLIAVVALLALAIPLGWELLAANMNGLILLGLAAAWLLHERGHDRAAGVLIGVMAVAKIWPGLVLFALPVRAIPGAVVGAGAALIVGLAGAGLSNHIAYLSVGSGVGASPLSLPGLTGIPWPVLAAAGLIGVLALRKRPRYAWALAVATMVLASPALYINHLALLLAAALPWLRPVAPSPEPTP